jgi:magnesium transporter
MKINNVLTSMFLDSHPADAARILEQVPDDSVTTFLINIPSALAAKVMEKMITPFAARYLQAMKEETATSIIGHMKSASIVRLFNAMDRSISQQLLKHLSEDNFYRIRRLLNYPPDSGAALMDPKCFLLPESISVSDARKRIENTDGLVSCEVYVVDDDFKLAGVVELNKLMSVKPRFLLGDVTSKTSNAVPARARVMDIVEYKAWKTYKTLPVVESDNTVIGLLKYKDMVDALNALNARIAITNTSEDVIAMASLYWSALTDIMNTALSWRAGQQNTGRG